MERLWRYLEDEPKTISAVLRCFSFYFVFYACYIMMINGRQLSFEPIGFRKILWYAYVALNEEAMYRAVPFYLLFVFLNKNPRWFKIMALIALMAVSFILFGALHDSLMDIFYQGVGGLVLGIIYLKFGGAAGKLFKPFATVFTFHWLYNILVFCIGL